jgi:D-lactate dehydrogenase (cytochrome)
VGSEGTLGVITELALRVHGIPEHAVAVRIAFPTLAAACATCGGRRRRGARGHAARAARCRDHARRQRLQRDRARGVAEPVRGAHRRAPPASRADAETLRELADGSTAFVAERDPTARSRLWQARHNVFHALVAATPGKEHFSTDVCVPVSVLPAAVAHARAELDRAGVPATIVAHAGDGNYHVLFMLDPDDPGELERARSLNASIVDWALDQGGTCTGEHGVGLGKTATWSASTATCST